MDAPDDQGEQDRPQGTADEGGGQDRGFPQARLGAIECQDLHGGEQCAQLLRRLTIDAYEGRAEQPDHPERQGDERAEVAQEAEQGGHRRADQGEAEQDRDAPADGASRVADTGEQRRQRGLTQRWEGEVFVERDDGGD